jgi:hypothetical protein
MPALVADQNYGATGDDMLLGMGLLKTAHVWLSNSSHTLLLQYPPQPTPAAAK